MLQMCVLFVDVWVCFCVRGCVVPSVCQPSQPSLALKTHRKSNMPMKPLGLFNRGTRKPMLCQIQYLHIQRSQTAAMFSLHEAARLTEAQMPLHRLCKTCTSSGLDSLIRFTPLFTRALLTFSVCRHFLLGFH